MSKAILVKGLIKKLFYKKMCFTADVMSKAMSSLMTHLPDEEKPALRKAIQDTRSQVSTLVAVKLSSCSGISSQSSGLHQHSSAKLSGRLSQRKVLSEKVVSFADQAIEGWCKCALCTYTCVYPH